MKHGQAVYSSIDVQVQYSRTNNFAFWLVHKQKMINCYYLKLD